MKPEELVKRLKNSVIDENQEIYRDIFLNTDLGEATDPYWQSALALFAKLSNEDREVLFSIIRQVSVDTISNVLGVLDGVAVLDGYDGEFVLTTEGSSEELNGDLQDFFLEIEENE